MLQSELLGASRGGRPIFCLRGGRGPRRVFFCAAHHGSEYPTGFLLQRFLTEFSQNEAWQEAARLWAVPWVNPDGCALSMGLLPPRSPEFQAAARIAGEFRPFPAGWKAGGSGVDLNLNYPARWAQAVETKRVFAPAPRDYPGPHPFSEPETRLLAAAIRRADPDVLVTLHAQGEEIYWEFGGLAAEGSAALGRKMAAASGYRLAVVPPESACAGCKDWFLQEFRRPAYTVEVGRGENPLPAFGRFYPPLRRLLAAALLGAEAAD